jgi:type I restriction enzyme S subunit
MGRAVGPEEADDENGGEKIMTNDRMTNDELPEGWLACSLGEVVDYGKTEKAEPHEIDAASWILELEDIEKDTSRLLSRVTFGERKSKSTKNCFKTGDVLYGKLRPYLNKILIADQPGYCTTEIIPLRTNGILENRYLFYWLKHPTFLDYVTAVSHGLNMPRLGTEAGKAAPFILAPLAEQKRIADKLEAVLGRVDACRARLDRVPALLKRFRQSVLAAATSGRLLADYDSDCDEHLRLSQVAELISGFAFKSQIFLREGEHQVLKIANVKDGRLDLSVAQAFISSKDSADNARFQASKSDILISMTGTKYRRDYGFVGMMAEGTTCWVNQRVAIVRADRSLVLPSYLLICMQSQEFRDQFFEGETGQVNQGNVGINHIGSCKVLLPPFPEQQEIVRRIEDLFAFADRIEARLATAQKTVERLTPATLAKAFRGELVPQDPNDEPARVLLEQLKTIESAPSSKAKRRQTTCP